MNAVRKSIAIAVASVVLAGGGVAATSPAFATSEGGFHSASFGSHDGAKSAERFAKRQAALHDKLNLTAAQEPAWKTFTERLQSTMPAKSETAPVANMTAPERADRMVAALQTAQQRAATRAQAVKEFYSGLTPEQQKLFDSQFQGHRHHHRG